MTPSFLHASSAKTLANDTLINGERNRTKIDDLTGLRMLLIEEDMADISQDVANSPMCPKLAFSLVMDSAYALVASSKLSCRGCTKSNDDLQSQCCRCCKVALLIPGETNASRKRRIPSNNASRVVGDAGKMDFPMSCRPENNSSFINNQSHWNENILNQIHIKYITSISDLNKYLAYAPSLPGPLQPLDGIFLMGLGDLLSKGNGLVEFTGMTNALSLLAHTGDALEANRSELVQETESNKENITLMCTLSQQTYQTLPQQMTHHLHQWADYVASIKSLQSDNENEDSSRWELVMKACVVFDSMERENSTSSTLFKVVDFYDSHHELCKELIWDARGSS